VVHDSGMEHVALAIDEHCSVKENLSEQNHHMAPAILSVVLALGNNDQMMTDGWMAVEMRYSYGELSLEGVMAAALAVRMHCQGHC
jgi:hypothetical protein